MRVAPLAGLSLVLLAACAEHPPTPLAPDDAPRLAIAPAGPQILIHEVMADPSVVADDTGEWFEVHNQGSTSVDLNGWQIRSANDAGHTIGTSVTVPAGGYVTLGRSSTSNGGITHRYVYGSSVVLANASDWLVLRNASGATVDSVAWGSSMPTGASRGVKNPSSVNTLVVGGNNWTTQTSAFGSGDKGTPGARNNGQIADLWVKVLDIGQGDAMYVQNGTSKIFIDGGPDSVRFGAHLDALALNNSTIDVVVLSHQHYDHHAGLRELFRASRNITVRYVFENKDAYSNAALAQLRDSINARVARGTLIYRDTDDPCGNGSAVCTIALNGGGKLHVMRPNPSGSTPNNRSTPVKVVGPDSAGFTLWAAGDAEHEEIGWFDTGANYDGFPGMKVNVLKANHHGSCNGVTSRYVALTNPDRVTFSVASPNDYGHVHTQTKDLFTSYGKPWYRTDQNGTITFRSTGLSGAGYTTSVEKGSSSAAGTSDRASSQAACNPLP